MVKGPTSAGALSNEAVSARSSFEYQIPPARRSGRTSVPLASHHSVPASSMGANVNTVWPPPCTASPAPSPAPVHRGPCAIAAALGKAAEVQVGQVRVEDRLPIEARIPDDVGDAHAAVDEAQVLRALGDAGEPAQRHYSARVVLGAAAAQRAGAPPR